MFDELNYFIYYYLAVMESITSVPVANLDVNVFDHWCSKNILNDFGVPMTLREALKYSHSESCDVKITVEPVTVLMMKTLFHCRCNGVFVRPNVIKFLSNPANTEFVKFMLKLRSEHGFCGYTCHCDDCTICCDDSRHVYLIDNHPIFIHQDGILAYELSLGSSACLLENSNLNMYVSRARNMAIRQGMDISKVKFPLCVADPDEARRKRFESLGLVDET
jgi:hypothetical protein